MTSGAGAPGSPRRLPPHPRDYPIIGSVLDFIRDTPAAFVNGWRQVGDVVLFRGPRAMVLVAHPDDVQGVLYAKAENYPRSPYVNTCLKVLLGDSSFTLDGESWQRRARLVHSLLRTAPAEAATRAAKATAESWTGAAAAGRTLDLYAETRALSLHAAAGLLFGSDPALDRAAFDAAAIVANEYVIAKVMDVGGPPDVRLRPAYRAYLRAVEWLDALLARAIAQRRRAPSDDYLSSLVRADAGLTDRHVRDEAMTLLNGVYGAVPSALMWTLIALSEHPDVARRLRAELPAGGGEGEPGAGPFRPPPYLERIVRESLRLYPPLWLFAKTARQEDEIRGFRIPAGMSVVISPYITHRHPQFWPNPESFDPDRFRDAQDRHPCAFLAFASGPRACPGDTLGQAMVQRALVVLLSRFRVERVPGHKITRRREFIFRPSNGLPVWVKPA